MGFFTVRDLEDHLTQHHHMHPSFAAVLENPPQPPKNEFAEVCSKSNSILKLEHL